MKKLSKDDLKAREEAVKKLTEAFNALSEAVDAYNDNLATEWESVAHAQEQYNDALTQAQEWRDGIVSQMEDYMGERSEKWREGEAAESYEAWKDQYEGVEFTESNLNQPDDLSIEIENPGDALEGLPNEVES